MLSKTSSRFDLESWWNRLEQQFGGLDPKDPSNWPLPARYVLLAGLALTVVTVLWFAWISPAQVRLDSNRAQEASLREEYRVKLGKAINLEALKKQREQVLQHVTQLERQLPSKAEMEALLSDINQAGLGRNLQFELFRPGLVGVKGYYAEQPIALRVSGRYRDIGGFVGDIANLARIVTLNNLTLLPNKDASLTMEATAKTFRYLDKDELDAQRKAVAPKGGAK